MLIVFIIIGIYSLFGNNRYSNDSNSRKNDRNTDTFLCCSAAVCHNDKQRMESCRIFFFENHACTCFTSVFHSNYSCNFCDSVHYRSSECTARPEFIIGSIDKVDMLWRCLLFYASEIRQHIKGNLRYTLRRLKNGFIYENPKGYERHKGHGNV